MGLSTPETIAEYVKDYDCLIEGIKFFLKLEQGMLNLGNTDPIRAHYERHPEDALCHVYRPGSRQMVLCRRSGIEAILRMTARLVAEAPNSHDLSRKRIEEIISERILQVVSNCITTDREFVQLLKSYVSVSESEHVEASYRFSCVMFCPSSPDPAPPPPDQFSLGPVTFQRFAVFVEEFNETIRRGEKKADDKTLELFAKNAEKYGWVASVAIPRCAPDVSRARAEEIIEAAINLLKLFIGLRHARSIRLPHTAPSRNRETCVLTDIENKVEWTWHGNSLEGALVAGDPVAWIAQPTRTCASHLLNVALDGNRDEATTRLLDALRWFGDASFEESGGVRIVKWIAALERLTATERLSKGITHNFCKRVALLASGLGTGNVEKAYRDAHRACLKIRRNARLRSQNDEHLSLNAGFVHDLTREAIVGVLTIHNFLTSTKGDGHVEKMGQLYENMASPHDALFRRLRRELRKSLPSQPTR